MMQKFRKFLRKSERGQAIILIAAAIVGLVAMVGLMTDTGLLLIEYGRLKRAIDAASISAALQFRQGYTNAELQNAAKEFLRLNQSDVFNIAIDTCDTDATLCTNPQRKLVKVTASRHVTFGFLRVLGINQTDITASSVGEAASIDLVLVIDTSASMAYETTGDPNQSDPGDDPSVCNASFTCEPLESVKTTAEDFLGTMFFPYDRVGIVALTSQVADGSRDPTTVLPLTNDYATVFSAIQNLRVFQPPVCNTAFGPCLNYPSGSYAGLECPLYRWGADLIPNSGDEVYDPSSCTSSNVGGALLLAGNEYTIPPVRQDSFWTVIALVGGPANASNSDATHTYGYCPPNTWNSATNPFCRDASASTRHSNGDPDYDADDYARDNADFLANPTTGQGITIFTIGLGYQVQHASKGDATAGEQLLTYIAETSGGASANHGAYYYAPDATGLAAIFSDIAKNIFTRLTQ